MEKATKAKGQALLDFFREEINTPGTEVLDCVLRGSTAYLAVRREHADTKFSVSGEVCLIRREDESLYGPGL